jgi:hypothetical protein
MHVAIAQGFLLTATSAITALTVYRLTQNYLSTLFALGLSVACLSRASWIGNILTETLFTFLLALHFYVCLLWWQQASSQGLRNFRLSLLVAITLALLILVRPIALYLWVVHGFAYGLFAVQRRPQKSLVLNVMLIAIVTGLCLAPWMFRNHQMYDKYMMTEFLGRNIWIVTYQSGSAAQLPLPETPASRELQERFFSQVAHPEKIIRSAYSPETIDDIRHTWHVSEALTSSGLNDAQVDQLMRRVALQSIGQGQYLWAEKALRRFVNYYRCVANELPALGTRWLSHRLWWCQVLMLVVMATILRGLWCTSTRPITIWLTGMIVYFGAVTALVEIPDYRYRLVIEPLCITLCLLALSPSRTPASSENSP